MRARLHVQGALVMLPVRYVLQEVTPFTLAEKRQYPPGVGLLFFGEEKLITVGKIKFQCSYVLPFL